MKFTNIYAKNNNFVPRNQVYVIILVDAIGINCTNLKKISLNQCL